MLQSKVWLTVAGSTVGEVVARQDRVGAGELDYRVTAHQINGDSRRASAAEKILVHVSEWIHQRVLRGLSGADIASDIAGQGDSKHLTVG